MDFGAFDSCHFYMKFQTSIFRLLITNAMTTKLILTIEDAIIESAKKYARQTKL